MAVYITGDTHCHFEKIQFFCHRIKTSIDDVMVILGDVGINYLLNDNDFNLKKGLSTLPITLFCIHGNHEIRPSNISSYKTKSFNGGIVYYEEEFPNILFAKDGEIYNFNRNKCMPIGGAYSVDKWYRILSAYKKHKDAIDFPFSKKDYDKAVLFVKGDIEDTDFEIRNKLSKLYQHFPLGFCGWFNDEQPSDEIKTYVEKQISENNVDVIFSHTCPLKYIPVEVFLSCINQSTVDKSTEEWLDKIEKKVNYKKWYCGHYHTDKVIDKIRFLFDDIVELI